MSLPLSIFQDLEVYFAILSSLQTRSQSVIELDRVHHKRFEREKGKVLRIWDRGKSSKGRISLEAFTLLIRPCRCSLFNLALFKQTPWSYSKSSSTCSVYAFRQWNESSLLTIFPSSLLFLSSLYLVIFPLFHPLQNQIGTARK